MQKVHIQEEVHSLLMVQWQINLLVHDVPIIKNMINIYNNFIINFHFIFNISTIFIIVCNY